MNNTTVKIKRLNYTSYQKKIIDSPARYTVTEASTKAGKTISHLAWLFEEAHKGQAGYEYWWVAPIFGQAEIAFKRLCRKVAESGVYIINLSKLTITTPLGTIIAFKSADNPNTLYGENVYAFVFDEYSRAKEEAWFALRSTITFTKGKGKFIGNVVARNWAYDLARKAESGTDPDFEYFKITAYEAVDAGILDISEIEQAKRDLPSRIFKMLYLADFSEVEGALWDYDLIDSARVTQAPDMVRIVIAIDPAVTSNKDSDETGIIVAGKGSDGSIYILEDLSGIYTPQEWAGKVLFAYEKHKADRIIAEVNNGGDMVETILRNYEKNISYDSVHATKGKFTRAEPVQALYEQKRVHHVGKLDKLEEQMTSWSPMTEKSPDRVDAMVWAVTYLMGEVKTNDFWVA
jgi:predicted phage terminase large subunit-like protein